MNTIRPTAIILYIILSALLLPLTVSGQNGKLLSHTLIKLEETPVWSKISDADTLRSEYGYLKKLDFCSFNYESDSSEVAGIWIAPKEAGYYPIVIFNRGGNRTFDRLTVTTMINYMSGLAARGYIVIGSNYREQDEFGGADINDVLYLLETIKELPMADTGKVGMMGWSRGGMMTYLALKNTDRIRTAIVGNAPTDLFALAQERPEMEQKVFAQCIPGYLAHKEAELQKRSVIYWPDKLSRKSNLLILCGTRDDRVNPAQADTLALRLQEIGYDFELKKFDTDHYFSGLREELNQAIIDWFDKNLKSEH